MLQRLPDGHLLCFQVFNWGSEAVSVDLEKLFAALKLVSAPQSMGTECLSASPGGFMFEAWKPLCSKYVKFFWLWCKSLWRQIYVNYSIMLLLNFIYIFRVLDGLFQLKILYDSMVFMYLYIIYVVYKYPSNHYPDAGNICKRKCCLNTTVLQNVVCFWGNLIPYLLVPVPGSFLFLVLQARCEEWRAEAMLL